MGPKIQIRWPGRSLRCARVVPWSRGPVVPWFRGPMVLWSRLAPVWPPSVCLLRLAPAWLSLSLSHSLPKDAVRGPRSGIILYNDTGAWTPNSKERAREREARRGHGVTGPSQHTERGHRAIDSGSWDTQPKPGWGRGTRPDGSQTGPRDHGTKPAHRTGPPGHRFWILGHPT